MPAGFGPTRNVACSANNAMGQLQGTKLDKTEITETADLVSEHSIRERAYHLWEADGRPEGRADHYWHEAHHQATAELIARSADGAARASGGKPLHQDQPVTKPVKAAKPKKVAEDAAAKPAKKAATKPRAAGVPTTH